jgi:L-ribulokinase
MSDRYVVGIDFGTLSGRAVVARISDGAERGAAIHEYRHGIPETLPSTGERLPGDWAIWLPEDYREVLRVAVPGALADAGVDPAEVIGIALDVTASTIMPARADGTPLCELPEFGARAHAYPKLWKHHAAQPQADRINRLAAERGEPWLARYGGRVSSEWQFAKALQILDQDPDVYAAADLWIEATDWLTWLLCGRLTRSAGTAGYKGLYQDGGYPSESFLAALDPAFAGFAGKLAGPVEPLGGRAGSLTPEAAAWTGLPAGIAVAVGNVDAHVTAAAANTVEPGQLLAIMGTSTCHVLNGTAPAEVPGMCGVVDGGIIAGQWGFEAGQSGVGDIFAWFVENSVPRRYADAADEAGVSLHTHLTEVGAREPIGAHGLIALDWASGNRSVLVDHELSGLVAGLTLSTRAPQIYRALQEATAFGARVIIEAFLAAGVPVTDFVAAGGLTQNKILMQRYADVLRRPIGVIGAGQGPALGSAIHAAVAAGAYPDVRTAAAAMGGHVAEAYRPDPAAADAYDALYAEYLRLHDHFGRGGDDLMHRLHAIRKASA